MMTIRRITEFPKDILWFLDTHAKEDFAQASDFQRAFWARSKRAWLISCGNEPLFIAGVARTSMIGTGIEFWFMCCKGIKRHLKRSLNFLRRALRHIAKFYPNMRVAVDAAYKEGVKFVIALGFSEVKHVRALRDRTFHVFSYSGA